MIKSNRKYQVRYYVNLIKYDATLISSVLKIKNWKSQVIES